MRGKKREYNIRTQGKKLKEVYVETTRKLDNAQSLLENGKKKYFIVKDY